MTIKNKLWIFLLLLSLPLAAAVKDPVYDNFEGLDLVEALIRDGRLQQAAEELAAARPSDRKNLVSGHLAFAGKHYTDAVKSYLKAPASPSRNLFLARAQGKAQQWKDCVASFKSASPLQGEQDAVLRATCEYRTEKYDEALATLKKGFTQWPGFVLQREEAALYLELGLTRAALDTVTKRRTPTASESLALAELFHNKKFAAETLIILEWTRARFPFDVETNLSLAKVYYGQGRLRATAEAFERAARVDGRYAYHAAEIRRQLGDTQIASYWLPQIRDEKERLRSRLSMYVDSNRYPLISSLEGILARSPLASDDEALYALSYSFVQLGESDKPLRYLSKIRSPQHMERATLLRKAVLDKKAAL